MLIFPKTLNQNSSLSILTEQMSIERTRKLQSSQGKSTIGLLHIVYWHTWCVWYAFCAFGGFKSSIRGLFLVILLPSSFFCGIRSLWPLLNQTKFWGKYLHLCGISYSWNHCDVHFIVCGVILTWILVRRRMADTGSQPDRTLWFFLSLLAPSL